MPHPSSFPARSKRASRSGVALVIALGMVVLITGLVLAFLSSASLERQLSSNSTTQARVDILAKGALATTVGDLLQEVVAGSTTTNLAVGTTNVTLYLPTTNATIVPARIGSDASLPNLVKRSASGQAFYSGTGFATAGAARAADSSTTNLSLNDRSVPVARWNKALLLPKSNTSQSSDLTPVGTFVAPDWIYLARDGSNPTAVSTNIVGRYAYAIYDEGGLLDANLAGYPSTSSPGLAAHKLGAGTADLTQIGLTTAESDALVGWRNYASAQAGGSFPSYTFSAQGTNYFNALAGNATGFLSVGSALFNGQSDRMMGSRQQLIQFLQQGVATSDTERANVQNALQYLGTFSRDINQPSFIPNPNRPAVVGPYKSATDGATFAATAGGNSAYGLDKPADPSQAINPPFLNLRATAVFTRSDGSKSVIGEPLVKKRFSLNRLAWITYAGPITSDGINFNSALPANYVTTLEQTYGLSQALLLQGTPANIQAYFGLTWNTAATTSTGGTAPAWVYGHSTPQATLNTLAQVQSLAPGREPDFFELLKAGMVVGSLAKGAASDHNIGYNSAETPPVDVDAYEYNYDTNVDYQIIQIGANIINECAMDSYPRHIVFNSIDFYGVVNLPYLYRARVIGVPLSLTAKVTAGGSGRGVMLLLPEVWDPYDPSSPQGSPGPTKFRFILTGSPLTGYVTAAEATCRGYANSGNGTAELTGTPFISTASGSNAAGTADQAQLDTYPFTSQKTGSTELDFGIAGSGLAAYQQPVFLGNVSTAAGSAQANSINLTVPTTNTLRSSPLTSGFVNSSGWVIDMFSKLSYCGVLLGDFPLSWTFQLPTSAGSFIQNSPYPMPLLTPSSTPAVANSIFNPGTADGCRLLGSAANASVPNQVHYLLQYQDASAIWRTYQDDYSVIPGTAAGGIISVATGDGQAPALGSQTDISQASTVTATKATSNDGEWMCWIDPRTSRFGAIDTQFFRSTYTSPNAMNYFGITTRPTADYGQGMGYYTPGSGVGSTGPFYSTQASQVGWYPGNWNTRSGSTATIFVPGYYAENTTAVRPAPFSNANFFTDPDGVARRGMGAYVSPTATTTPGMPLATLAGTQGPSRPFLLHRPFRSVAELGYVFSGTPWRNLDFFTPESGAAPLLDLFCISDTNDPNGLTEGKVDLNTRQPLVLQALLSGSGGQGAAYKDEVNAATSGGSSSLSSSEVAAIAQALVARTTSTAASTVLGQGPLSNLSELVGKYNSTVLISGATAPHNIDGSQSYVGFSSDLTTIFNSSGTSADTTTTPYVQRFKEAAIRPLAASGQTRVWNLMIDLVAQTGRYQPNETLLDRFNVDGERRYWLHVAIDRYTGQILDEQLEPVQE